MEAERADERASEMSVGTVEKVVVGPTHAALERAGYARRSEERQPGISRR